MANDYFNHGSYPATGASGSSAAMRAELDAITAGFAKLPVLAGSALKLVRVNAGATALESTNLIDSITIGSVTPAPGTFTTLASTGLATLASATVTGAATVSGVLVANGNVTLGDALADTITIGGGSSKNATGNWVFAAPSSGTAVTVNGVAGAIGQLWTDGSAYTVHLKNKSGAWIGGAGGNSFAIGANDATMLSMNTAGNVTIAAPSSGDALTVAGNVASRAITVSGTSAGAFGVSSWFTQNEAGTIRSYYCGASGAAYQPWEIYRATSTGSPINVMTFAAAGNVTIAAPSSGVPVTINAGATGVSTLALAGAPATGFKVFGATGSTTAHLFSDFSNTSGSFRFGVESSVGGIIAGGSSAYSSMVGSGTATDFHVVTNLVVRTTWTSGGNVTIAAPSSGTTLTATGVQAQVVSIVSAAATDCEIHVTASGTREWALVAKSASAVFAIRDVGGAADRLTVAATGIVDVTGGTGKLTMAGGITRFASAEQTCPSGTTAVSVAHGGPRIPDIVRVVLRNKTTEGGYAVGDEYDITNLIDISDGTRGSNTTCDATNVVWRYTGAGITPAIRNTSNALIAVTAANWKVVFYCHWL